ncbi:18637_t:CDS:2, partial [Funneliformis geosporum]
MDAVNDNKSKELKEQNYKSQYEINMNPDEKYIYQQYQAFAKSGNNVAQYNLGRCYQYAKAFKTVLCWTVAALNNISVALLIARSLDDMLVSETKKRSIPLMFMSLTLGLGLQKPCDVLIEYTGVIIKIDCYKFYYIH